MALARLSYHLDRPDLREEAMRAVRAWGKPIGASRGRSTKGLAVVDFLLEGPVELALVGTAARPVSTRCAARSARATFRTASSPITIPPPARRARPCFAARRFVGGRAALYVCRGYAASGRDGSAKVSEALDTSRRADPAADGTPAAVGAARLAGAATEEATSAYARRHRAGDSGTGRWDEPASSAAASGFGGYRVDDETPEHGEALRRALLAGCNLIDTSTNYTDGGSETLIGECSRTSCARGG